MQHAPQTVVSRTVYEEAIKSLEMESSKRVLLSAKIGDLEQQCTTYREKILEVSLERDR